MKLTQRPSDLLLCEWNRHFRDGFDLGGVYFYTLLVDDVSQ